MTDQGSAGTDITNNPKIFKLPIAFFTEKRNRNIGFKPFKFSQIMQIKCTGIFNDQNPIGLSQGYAGRRLEVDKQAIFDEMDLHSGLRSNPVAFPSYLG